MEKDKTIEEMLDIVNGLKDDPDPCVCIRLQEIKEELSSINDKLVALKLYQELGTNTDGAVSQAVTTAELLKKQNLLIGSGEGQNIKTINGNNLLGEGNIEISGSGTTVYDGLDSTSTTDALSANMGRVLNEKFLSSRKLIHLWTTTNSYNSFSRLGAELSENVKIGDILIIDFIECSGSWNHMPQTNIYRINTLSTSYVYKLFTNAYKSYGRNWSFTAANHIVFENGQRLDTYGNSNWTNDSTVCIPRQIFILREITD